jgi:dolichol-phosphate mannosyltransferase
MISLVIPTYNEAGVIEETLRRAAEVLRGTGEPFELIVVDDSSGDGTAAVVESLSGELPVRVLRRAGRLGLATAVVDGWGIARGDVLGVMDADLQHPPEVLTRLVAALRTNNADLAVATRYIKGGGTAGWSWFRRFVSWAGVRLGAIALPWTLGGVKDPASGMFLVRAQALEGVQLRPLGIKTLLEVLAKSKYRKLVEVPYVFQGRARGESKLGARQYIEYMIHLGRVARSTGELRAWIRYSLVGLSGAVAYLLVLYLLAEWAGWRLIVSVPLAVQLALLHSFSWNSALTFPWPRAVPRQGGGVLARFLRYEGICLPAAILTALVTLVLIGQGVSLLAAGAVGILVGALWSLVVDVPAIWGLWRTGSSGAEPRSG